MVVVILALLEIRCAGQRRNGRECGALLQKIEAGALLPGKRTEIKCHACNFITVVEGTSEPDIMMRL